jgi:hypothetical protein
VTVQGHDLSMKQADDRYCLLMPKSVLSPSTRLLQACDTRETEDLESLGNQQWM